MAEEEERQGPRPANNNRSPNGASLDPRSLQIASATPKEDSKVKDILPAFVNGGIHVTESQSPALQDKRTAEDRPNRDYLETTRTFWQPYAERELTREDAREMAHNLIGFFTVLREWTLRERERARCGVVERASSPSQRKRGRLRTRAAARDKRQS
jgi:hypothetical protein